MGTNDKLRTVTGEAGSYAFPLLDPVMYRVTVEAGQVSTEVTVTAEAAQLNAESGAFGADDHGAADQRNAAEQSQRIA